jgi:GntP family gluconate:H+ symporter
MREFGVTAGKVSFVIAIASILGIALTESGAAERIVNQLLKIFGEQKAGIALLIAGFILSIPVFFDTVFFLLIPLGIVLARKTGKNFLLFVMAIGGGGVITHSLVPPTPGPLVMAEALSMNLGLAIVAGVLSGIIPAIVGYKFSQRQDRLMPIQPPSYGSEAIEKTAKKLPSFGLSILPILLPLSLIIGASILNLSGANRDSFFFQAMSFLGNKNIAMFLGLLISLYLWAKHKGLTLKGLGEEMERPLELAGLIILITAAGGAFGAMIRNTGIGDMIQSMSANGFSINLIIVAWALAAIMKFAQGSGTVSVITTAGIMAAIIPAASELPYHPIYIYIAIGYGSMIGSWMNDSGFWIVGKLSGMTEKETIKSWSALLVVLGVVGGMQVLILSYILPLN